jgi:hypothetical protein
VLSGRWVTIRHLLEINSADGWFPISVVIGSWTAIRWCHDCSNFDSSMSGSLNCALPVLLFLSWFCALSYDGHSLAASPVVLLEATNTIHSSRNPPDKRVMVRLTADGKVEWDDWVRNAWKLQTSSIDARRVLEITEVLRAVDQTLVRDKKLGPYHTYDDTDVELQIRMDAGRGPVAFTVLNPWSSGLQSEPLRGTLVPRPMPHGVKVVVCEIATLNSELEKTPLNEMCKADAVSH